MRCNLHVAALSNEVDRVKAFVAAHRHAPGAGNLFQHHQRGIALGRPVGFPHHRIHDQPVTILHQQIAAVAQLRLLALALTRQLRLRIGLRRMRPVGPLFAVKVHRGIAGIVGGWQILAILALKTLCSRPRFQHRAVHREVFVGGQALQACSTTCAKNSLAISPSNSRSRFLLNTVASHTSSSNFSPTNQRNSRL